jgi:elongation factor G
MQLSIRGKEEIQLEWGGKMIYHTVSSVDPLMQGYARYPKRDHGKTGKWTAHRILCQRYPVYVYDWKMHPVDSNEISFKLAGAKAFADAFRKGRSKNPGTDYEVEVLTPSDRMGDVMSDLQGRRAMILE